MPVPSLSGVSIDIDRTAPVLVSRQLYDRLGSAFADGRLRPGYRLPSSRSLADELGVSRNTVSSVIDQLAAEGYIDVARGRRPSVAIAITPSLVRGASRQARARSGAPLSAWARRLGHAGWPFAAEDTPRPFVPGLADWRAFPHQLWGPGPAPRRPRPSPAERRHQPPGTAGRPGAAPGRSSRGQDDARADHRHTVGAGRDRAGQSHHAQCRRRRLARGPPDTAAPASRSGRGRPHRRRAARS